MKRSLLNLILRQYREGLRAILGQQFRDIVLYGSEARGQAVEDSDVDVLIVLNAPFEYGDMILRTSELTAQLSLSHDCVLSRTFVTQQEYESKNTPFLMNVRREGSQFDS